MPKAAAKITKKEVKKEAKKVETPMEVKAEKKTSKPVEKTNNKMKKVITGKIVSVKMQNTVIVSVVRQVAHKKYGKLLKVTKRFKVDTNGMELAEGDTVKIEQTKPISKTKFFKVISKGATK